MSATSHQRQGGSVRCPYPGCTFSGTNAEVDEHRSYSHRDEAQAGSNV